MSKNDSKQKQKTSVEKHDTTTWSSIKHMNPISDVTNSNEQSVAGSKEYNDTNKKADVG